MRTDSTIRIAHVVSGLSIGGAEQALIRLLPTLNRGDFESIVICLTSGGPLVQDVEALGVPLTKLGCDPIPGPRAALRLASAMRRFVPNLIQGWMYHGNLAALAAGALGPEAHVVWNVRHSVAALDREKPSTRCVIRLGGRLSSRVAATIYNARSTERQHRTIGYRGPSIVIPNGFDTESYVRSPVRRSRFRQEHGLAEGTFVIGHVARFHAMKDHATLIRAAGILARSAADVRFLLAGPGVDRGNSSLVRMIEMTGHPSLFHLLGVQRDIPSLMASIDLLVLSSAWGEAFPNVVGEAMACGVPAVVTDVGDSALIVGDTGAVVPPEDPARLAEAITLYLAMPPEERLCRGDAARRMITDTYSLGTVTRRYEELYRGVLNGGRPARSNAPARLRSETDRAS